MHVEEFRAYCLQKVACTESFPFDETTLVFKVAGKMFALLDLTADACHFSVKCEPEKAIQLREQYTAVQPAYHFNKKHWNSVIVDGSIPDRELFGFIDHSYDLVVSCLTSKERNLWFPQA